MMFTWHLYLMQSYIQAVLYIYITDYMMSLTLYTPISECIFSILFSIYFLMCWQREFFLINNNFFSIITYNILLLKKGYRGEELNPHCKLYPRYKNLILCNTHIHTETFNIRAYIYINIKSNKEDISKIKILFKIIIK